MPIINVNDLQIGQTIIFKSKSPYDNVQYKGDIIALSSYDLVKHFQDLLPYYNDISKTVSLPPLESLNYVVINVYENDNITGPFAFAKEWIEPTSLNVVSTNTFLAVKIYNVDNTHLDQILTLLRLHGYICSDVTDKIT